MKQRSRKSLKITDSVVRGEKDYYEFEVFPIATEFEAQPAVYIFSRRKIDKSGRGHQKFLRIGQTASLAGDFAKYKKSFAAQSKANVICVRIEDEENSRSKIEGEVKAAHNISCSNETETVKIAPAKISRPEPKSGRVPPSKKPVLKQASKLETEKPPVKRQLTKTSNEVLPVKLKSEKTAKKSLPLKTKTSKPEVQKSVQKAATQKDKAKNASVRNKPLPRNKTAQLSKIIKTTAAKNKSSVKNPANKNKTAAKNTGAAVTKLKDLKVKNPRTVKNARAAENIKSVKTAKGGKQRLSAAKSKISQLAAPQKVKPNGKVKKTAAQKTVAKTAKNVKKQIIKDNIMAVEKPAPKSKSRKAKSAARKQLAF